MAEVLGTVAFVVVVAFAGFLVGRVITGSRPLLQRGALIMGVFLAWTVAMVVLVSGGDPPPLSSVDGAIALIMASPMIFVASTVSLLARILRISPSVTRATAAAAAVVSWPLCVLVGMGASCLLAGNCA
jgi:hypothetical protein